ncbi:MAG TPA: ABC transporter permease [Terriglobales bacterium]|nr:ABC transporter permease [Terriglobales bacterium]
MGTFFQDLRFAARSFRKTPGFVLIGVIALALGIGANTAMFSIVNGVLLRPVPYPHADRLLKLYSSMPQFRESSISYPNFLDWQRRSQSFDALAAFRNDTFNFTGQGEPERLRGYMVSSTIFDTLGVKPIIGRVFTPEEDQRGGNPVALLTANYWKTRFGADPGVLGRALTLNDKLYTVVGVVPSDDVILQRSSVLIPIGQWTEPLFWDRSVGMGMRAVGRLKAGVSPQHARSELDAIAAELSREYPKENKDSGIYAVSVREDLVGDVRTPLLILLGAVGFVLLIACANVANLLLARSTARRREFAIRGALGARRTRVMQQLLTEGLLLAFAGGALAIAIAWGLNAVFVTRFGSQLPRADQIHLDGSVLVFTAVISVVASLLFSLTPALQSSRSDLNETLKEGARGNTGRHTFQRFLVVTEVALAVVLTVSAGLMIRSMARIWSVDPGLDPHNVLDFGIAGSPAVHGAPAAVRNGIQLTADRLRALPGVTAVSVVFGGTPLTGSDSELWYWVEGRPKPADHSQMDLALFYGVDADYFNVFHIPLRRGRLISNRDLEASPCAIDIDEDLAKKAFPGQDPVGQHINLEILNLKCEVVGVVGHVKHWGLDSDATSKVHSQFYIPFRQFPDAVMDLASSGGSEWVVRTASDPYSTVPLIRRTVADINGRMVMYGAETMDDNIKDLLASRRFTRLLLGVFAGLALALAAVGIYGVVSYTVTQATHDIGVRMALGATTGAVLSMVIGSAMKMAGLGIAIGAAIGFAATQAMKGLLYGVGAGDPLTFIAVALVLAAVTLLASYVPARRATKVDPMIALRVE